MSVKTGYCQNLFKINSKINFIRPNHDSFPEQPSTYLSRKALVNDLCSKLQGVYLLSLYGSSGRGKTQLARELVQLCQYKNVCWISFRATGEENIHQHLLEQLLLWLDRIAPYEHFWNRFQFNSFSISEIIFLLQNYLSEPVVLVLDDLPIGNDFFRNPAFLLIKQLLDLLQDTELKIVTTSITRLPQQLTVGLRQPNEEVMVPSLVKDEIKEMLTIAQVPQQIITDMLVSLIEVNTRGILILVLATVQWLRQFNADRGSEAALGLLEDKPTQDLRDEYQLILQQTVSNDKCRELLYRLSLGYSGLKEEFAFVIAQVEPAINLPMECINQLAGVWLDYIDENSFRVSPLLKDSGKHNLGGDLQAKIHEAIADHYLEEIVNISDAFAISMHLLNSGNHERFVWFLLHLVMMVDNPSRAEYLSWIAEIFTPEMGWKNLNVSLGTKIVFRSLQLKIRVLSGKTFAEFQEDLEQLLEVASTEESLSILIAFGSLAALLSKYSNLIPVLIALKITVNFVRIFHEYSSLLEEIQAEFPGPVENIVWFQVARITNKNEIDFLAKFLLELQPQDLRRFFEAEFAISTFSMALDRLWLIVLGKNPSDADLKDAFDLLDSLRTPALEYNIEAMLVGVERAHSLVVSNYLKEIPTSLQNIQPFQASSNKAVSSLANFTVACIYLDDHQYALAVPAFEKALANITKEWDYAKFTMHQFLGLAYSHTEDWTNAKSHLIETVRTAKNEPHLIYMYIAMLGELAWIHWQKEEKIKACTCLVKIAELLRQNRNMEEPSYVEMLNKLHYAIAWYAPTLSFNQSPATNSRGEDYRVPSAGYFNTSYPDLGHHHPQNRFSDKIMLSTLSRVINQLKFYKLAWAILKLAQGLEETQPVSNWNKLLRDLEAVPDATLAARFGKADLALEYGITASHTHQVLQGARIGSPLLTDLMHGDLEISSIWNNLPDTEKIVGEQTLLMISILPMFLSCLANRKSPEDRIIHLDNWIEALKLRRTELLLVDDYVQIVVDLRELLENKALGSKESNQKEKLISPWGKNFLALMGQLVESISLKGRLQENIQQQTIVVYSVIVSKSSIPFDEVLSDLGQILHSFWLEIARTRRFALSSPDLFIETLARISSDQGGKTIADTMFAAAKALKVQFSDDITEQLRTLAN